MDGSCTNWYSNRMTRRITVTGTAHSSADAHVLYELLRDRPSWPTWSSLGRYEHVSGTEGELDSVCVFVTNGIRSVERIVELVPDRRLSYALLSGLPMRDYRANVDLTPTAAGTDVQWQSSFEPKVRGTGWFFRAMMGALLPRMAAALARRADELVAGAAPRR